MSKERKVDERILRDQIIRKAAVDNMTNIAKQRQDLKTGIMPVAPIVKTATELAEDRTYQAGLAIQNLLDLGFKEKEASDISNNLDVDGRVGFNRAYPQIKADFGTRFDIKNITPEFFINYIHQYLDMLTATNGVPSNIAFAQDNLITTTADLRKLILVSEFVAELQAKLVAEAGLTPAMPLNGILTNLVAELPTNSDLNDIDLLLGGADQVEGYKIVQILLTLMQALPNMKSVIKIAADTKTSNAQKLRTLEQRLGTLTPAAIASLNQLLKVDLPAHVVRVGGHPAPVLGAPVVGGTPPSTPISTPSKTPRIPRTPVAIAAPTDLPSFISLVDSLIPKTAVAADQFVGTTAKGVPFLNVGSDFIAIITYTNKKAIKFGFVNLTNDSPLTGFIIKEGMTYTELTNIIKQSAADAFANAAQTYVNSMVGSKGTKISGKLMRTFIEADGQDITIEPTLKRVGSGMKKTNSIVIKSGLKPIKLGNGISIKKDTKDNTYKFYDEDLGLEPKPPLFDKRKKTYVKKPHTVSDGIECDKDKFNDRDKRYISFGKFAINTRQLNCGNLQVVYKSLSVNPNFPTKKISPEFQQYLFELLTNKKSIPALHKHMSESEKNLFEKLAVMAGVFDKLNLPKMNSLENEKKEMERFDLLHGEFMAGNDNKQIVRELRKLILKFLGESRISKPTAYEYLLQLNECD